jgi:hypothetical protein
MIVYLFLLVLIGIYFIGLTKFWAQTNSATEAFLVFFWPVFFVAAVCWEIWDNIKERWNERRAR